MSFYKNNLLNHFKDIQPVLERLGAQAALDARTFQLEVRAGGGRFVLHPQFFGTPKGQSAYTPHFGPDVSRFIGWCPYFNKRWPLSDAKLRFKDYARANGLPTPEYSRDPAAVLEHVVVKRSASSFGRDIHGPFRSSRERALQAERGEYYERFVDGRIVKVWFWNERAVCLEIDRHPTVTGDGRKSIRQLIESRCAQRGLKVDLPPIAA